MATYFSDQFAAAGTETAAPDYSYTIPQAGGATRIDRRIARATTDGTTAADVFRMFGPLHSGVRLYDMLFQVASTPSAGDIDVGLHLSGVNHDGAVVDADLFEDGQLVTSGLSLAGVFTGASLTNLDRGKTLWELAALGAATYTSDPNVFFDITVTTATGWTTASVEFLMVADFLVEA